MSPTPGGRGGQPRDKPPLWPRNRRWWALFGGLLALNLVLAFATARPAARERVPYQPFFVGQLNAGNVASISSPADSIDGQLKRAVLREKRAAAWRRLPAQLADPLIHLLLAAVVVAVAAWAFAGADGIPYHPM